VYAIVYYSYYYPYAGVLGVRENVPTTIREKVSVAKKRESKEEHEIVEPERPVKSTAQKLSSSTKIESKRMLESFSA